MKKFQYVITDEIGLHARPAGLLVKEAKKFESRIQVTKGDCSAGADRLMALLGLGIKCGDRVEVTMEGPDEEQALEALKAFFEKNL